MKKQYESTNLDSILKMPFNPEEMPVVSVYSCPAIIGDFPTTTTPVYPYGAQPITAYECEICGKIIKEPRVICYSCKDKLRRILDIKENW